MKHSSKGVLFFRTVITAVFLIGLSGGIGGCSGSSGGGPVSVNFIDGATGVSVDSSFRYTFAQFIDQSSVTGASYFIVPAAGAVADVVKSPVDPTICDPVNALPASVRCPSPAACDLTPDSNLNGNVRYSICLTSDIQYLNGWSFAGFMATFMTAGGSYAVGGTLSGLGAGEEVVLQNNGADDIEVTADGPFTFATAVADNSAYAVTVLSQPAGKFFTVTNGNGTISGADVTDVTVACAAVAPGIAAIKAALGANNANGMVPGLALGGITLPVCTKADGSALDFEVTYSMTDLPAWLAFDASTRGLTLNGVGTVPTDAYTASAVTYKCTDSADTTQFASISFTINDLDQGGVVDGFEYENGYVPLVNDQGSILLNPSNIVLYRGGTSDFKVPTSIIITAVGMNPTDAADDTADFDGDTLTNLAEIVDETNIFVALSAGTFAAAVNYAVVDMPLGMTTGDFNGDGYLDLAVTNRATANVVSVLLGNGDGTFDPKVDYAVGDTSVDVTTGDFNGDGYLDLAVANRNTVNVSVLIGNGDGTFDPAVNYVAGDPFGITTGDFNGDGYLDLATANYNNNKVSVLLGVGDGTFAAVVNYAVGIKPVGITTGDFNGDGYLDLAAANATSNDVSVLLGVGDGTFAAAVNYAVTDAYFMITGDFDGDGDLDLAVASSSDDNVFVLLGNGDGTFVLPAVNYAVGDFPMDITTGDFNGDGDLDLATANGLGNNVSVLFGTGDGTFVLPAVNYAADVGTCGITTGDFNGDGDMDLAATNTTGDNVSVLLNQ